ncbi:MAG TPA: glycosyltransferase [Candidatus Acidoferrales bacterium]|nr:glycosyltransferase [Candidatus Acidoferrales bacterium]
MNELRLNGRLLVFDCHEAWVYQLRAVDRPLDIIVGLPGRATSDWDTSMRPVPSKARCIRLPDVLAAREQYDCIIAHNLSDLLDVKSLPGPRMLVIHGTLGGMILDQQTATPPDDLRRAVSQYVRMTGAHVMAVSHLKGRSWALDEDVVPLSADPADYPTHSGDIARGLRVANQIRRKLRTLNWDFHEKTFAGLPLTLVGRNDEMPGVSPARGWNDLKEIFRRHRFFVHTAEPSLEDGYNMATLEAMAAGLPVLGNCHPTSPIRNGVNGFLSDDPAELRMFAWQLLRDSDLAIRLGFEARKTVTELFSTGKFKSGIERSIETARKKWTEFHSSTFARHAEI